MTFIQEVLPWLLAGGLLIPLAVLAVECWAALCPPRRSPLPPESNRPRCAVLIPAQNEETTIGPTIRAILPQLQPKDRLVVVADNCTDATAAAARSLGATVVERTDPERRGKGFALDAGVRFLEGDPPAVVVMVDADCRVSEGAVDALVREAAFTGRPTQAAYWMDAPPGATPRDRLSAFAFQFKNLVRPLGLDRLGQPCLLTGSGMSFPWPVLRKADLAHADLVEDMRLGLDLAAAGHPPRFCPRARVTGVLPARADAALSQRRRWEHGHLRTLFSQVPRLTAAAIRQRYFDLAALALEVSVPPLAVLFLLWAVITAGLCAWAWFSGSWTPGLVLLIGGLTTILSILAAGFKRCPDRPPLSALLAVPGYLLWKMPLYLAYLVRPQRAWVRTPRDIPPTLDR